jgi:rRNA maturation protein Nop10
MLGNSIVLPSKGIPYPNLVGGKVEILPMKTGQEALLAGRTDMISILNALISKCVPTLKEVGLNPLQLLSGDRLFLLFMIRKFTYGSSYGFKIKCPNCGLMFRKEIHIPDELEINELSEGLSEPYIVKLSDNTAELGFRLLTGNDEVEIDRYKSQAFKRGVTEGDPAYIYTLARHIVNINGKSVNLSESLIFISENMTGMDSLIFQEAIRNIEPGFSKDLEFECPSCGYEIETPLPFSPEFFRPKLRGGR